MLFVRVRFSYISNDCWESHSACTGALTWGMLHALLPSINNLSQAEFILPYLIFAGLILRILIFKIIRLLTFPFHSYSFIISWFAFSKTISHSFHRKYVILTSLCYLRIISYKYSCKLRLNMEFVSVVSWIISIQRMQTNLIWSKIVLITPFV